MPVFKIANNIFSAEINSIGAELISLKKGNTNFIWEVDKTYWDKTSPVLFPIVGKLKNDNYKIDGKKFYLPRHGFAREFEFAIENHSNNSVTFLLKDNDETQIKFPFQFELRIIYTLHKKKLKIEYQINNKTLAKMPFSIGAHPAFSITEAIDNYSLFFENDTEISCYKLDDGLFSGEINKIILNEGYLPLSYDLFKDDAIVLKKLNSTFIEIYKNSEFYLRINFENFPHLGIWTKQNAPFLCIEPWQGYADSLNNNPNIFEKEGIIVLEQNDNYNTSFSIEIL